jgi:hypothetical protein
MRVSLIPQWLPLTQKQQEVFAVLYSQIAHSALYGKLFKLCSERLHGLTKPRLSDLLRSLEAKGLVARANPSGTWLVNDKTIKALAAQAVGRSEEKAKAAKEKAKRKTKAKTAPKDEV